MEKATSKLMKCMLLVFVAVLFIIGLRDVFLSDSEFRNSVEKVIGSLPFADQLKSLVCKILGEKANENALSQASVIEDLVKISILAVLQPAVCKALNLIIRPMPSYMSLEDQERRMDLMGYKFKGVIISMISVLGISVIASNLIGKMMEQLNDRVGSVGTLVIGIAIVVAFGIISVIALVLANVTVLTASVWRIMITYVSGICQNLVVSALWILLYVAFTEELYGSIPTVLITWLIFYIIFDYGMECLKLTIVKATR